MRADAMLLSVRIYSNVSSTLVMTSDTRVRRTRSIGVLRRGSVR